MDLVSAIITTHNRPELLKRAIKSVLSQSYPNIECIVVDDASIDNTKEICKEFNVRYIFIPKEESHGGNYARNLGIMASKGKYCAFLDDDDYWLPEKIFRQVLLIEKLGCELVYCGRRMEYVSSIGVEYRDVSPYGDLIEKMQKRILYTICTTTSCIMVMRNALLEVGNFDEDLRFWQEYELTIRLAQRQPFCHVNEPLTVYRVDKRDSNRLTNKYDAWKKAVKQIYAKHSALFDSLNFFEKQLVRLNYVGDAIPRAKASGLIFEFILHKIEFNTLCIPARAYLHFYKTKKKI